MLIPYLVNNLRHVSPPTQYPDVLFAYSSFQSDRVQKRVPSYQESHHDDVQRDMNMSFSSTYAGQQYW